MKTQILTYFCFYLIGFNTLAQESWSLKFEEFVFDQNSTELTDDHYVSLDSIAQFIYDHPKLQIDVCPFKSEEISDSLCKSRYQTIERYFINKGLSPFHFNFKYENLEDYPHSPETANATKGFYFTPNHFIFFVNPNEVSACDSVGYRDLIHFEKSSNQIFETECHTLKGLFKLISENKHEWAVLGIAKKDTPESRALALKRANQVIDELVKMGIDRSWFVPFANWHEEPLENEPRDWPYYPTWYSYEIGVYLQPHI